VRRERAWLLGLVLTALCLLWASTAVAAPKQYLLKHPRREHCKAGYAKRTLHVIKRSGRTVKITETVCVRLATPAAKPLPTPVLPVTNPAPPSTPTVEAPKETPKEEPKGPFATTTKLELSEPEECGIESLGGSGSNNYCRYDVAASVLGNGSLLTLPKPEFVFSNPAEPKGDWVVSGESPFRIQVNHEKVGSVQATSLFIPGEALIGTVNADQHFSVYAKYAGTTGFNPSQSAPRELVP